MNRERPSGRRSAPLLAWPVITGPEKKLNPILLFPEGSPVSRQPHTFEGTLQTLPYAHSEIRRSAHTKDTNSVTPS